MNCIISGLIVVGLIVLISYLARRTARKEIDKLRGHEWD